jgi:hypothetical protein
MATKEYASELEEMKDLMELKDMMRWGDEDDEYTTRVALINKKWLNILKKECKGKGKPPPKDDEEDTERVHFDKTKVLHTDKQSQDFTQVREALTKFRKGTWKVPSKSRGNNLWRHYILVDAKGGEQHFKVVLKDNKYQFFGGVASGKPIPDSDSQDSDAEGAGAAPDAEAAVEEVPSPEDTSARRKGKGGKRKPTVPEEAAQAAPKAAKGGKQSKKRAR